MRYMMLVERRETGWGADVRNLLGCLAVGATSDEVLRLICAAIELHIEGLKQEGLPLAGAGHRGRGRRGGRCLNGAFSPRATSCTRLMPYVGRLWQFAEVET